MTQTEKSQFYKNGNGLRTNMALAYPGYDRLLGVINEFNALAPRASADAYDRMFAFGVESFVAGV